MENAQVNKAGSLLEPLTGSDSPAQRRHFRWRSHLESIVIPFGAIVVSLVAFGAFCALAGANPSAVYASIYKAAFGSWYSFQNTLVRAAPLMLCSLGTAIPFQLGLVMIGSEGALVIGGLFDDELHRNRASEPGYQYLGTRPKQSEQTRKLSDPG
jgi:hypothetical protein